MTDEPKEPLDTPSTRRSLAPPGEGAGSLSIPPPRGSRLAEACGLGAVCALVGSIPSALRAAREGGSLPGGWIASAAMVLPLLISFIALSRAAGRGFRMLTGNRANRGTAAGLALWIGLSSPVLVVLGTVLKAGTNHRGIGGATFGVLALVIVVGSALVAHRIVQIARRLVERGRGARLVAAGFAFITLTPLIVISLLVARSGEETSAGRAVVATLVDGAIFLVAGALAASSDGREELRSRTRAVGPVVALALFASGFAWVMSSSTLGPAIRAGGGLAAALIGGLGRS